jgi:hypothetical protein
MAQQWVPAYRVLEPRPPPPDTTARRGSWLMGVPAPAALSTFHNEMQATKTHYVAAVASAPGGTSLFSPTRSTNTHLPRALSRNLTAADYPDSGGIMRGMSRPPRDSCVPPRSAGASLTVSQQVAVQSQPPAPPSHALADTLLIGALSGNIRCHHRRARTGPPSAVIPPLNSPYPKPAFPTHACCLRNF